MNNVSLNNLWSYLQGLTLTASNKKWLADHLYESAKTEENPITKNKKQTDAAIIRNEKAKLLLAEMPKMSKEELAPSQDILDIVKNVDPMPDDVDIEKIKYDYLTEK